MYNVSLLTKITVGYRTGAVISDEDTITNWELVDILDTLKVVGILHVDTRW